MITIRSIGDYAGLVTVAPLFSLLLARLAEALGFVPSGRLRRFLKSCPKSALTTTLAVFGFTLLLAVAAATTDLRAHAMLLQSAIIGAAVLSHLVLAVLAENQREPANSSG